MSILGRFKMAETRINIRASEELKKMVEELAKSENRTVTNYLETLITSEYKKLTAKK
jgi:uncharacterized protein (DUF1778 family)